MTRTSGFHAGHVSVFAFGLLLLGCTTSITHQKLNQSTVQNEPGFSYFLPQQKYTASLVYELTRCPKDPNITVTGADDFEIRQTASVVEQSEADVSEEYLLTYESANSTLKTSTFNATTYPNRTIKTVGVTIEDKASAVIKNITGTAISVAKMVVGVPTAAAPQRPCNDGTYRALKAVRDAEAIIIDPATDSKAKTAAAETISHAMNQLRISATIELIPTSSGLASQNTLTDAQLEKWFVRGFRAHFINNLTTSRQNAFNAAISTELAVTTAKAPRPGHQIARAGEGVVYRDPMPATVWVCAPKCGAANRKVSAKLDTQIAQLGPYMVVTLENRAFDKNNVSLTFAANGALESMTFGTESSLEKITGALADTAAQARAFEESRRKKIEAEEAEKESATLNAIKAETDLLNAKSARIEAENKLRALGGDPSN